MMHDYEQKLIQALVDNHPAIAARYLEVQPPKQSAEFLCALNQSIALTAFKHLVVPYGAQVIGSMTPEQANPLLVSIESEHLVDIVRCLNTKTRVSLLAALPSHLRRFCKLILTYSQDTVGAWMNSDIIMLRPEYQAQEALTVLSNCDFDFDSNYLPVIDEQRSFLGFVSTTQLWRSPAEQAISTLMKNAHCIRSRSTMESARNHKGWSSNQCLPVLNRNQHLVGLLHLQKLNQSERFNKDIDSESPDLVSEPLGFLSLYLSVLTQLLSLGFERVQGKRSHTDE